MPWRWNILVVWLIIVPELVASDHLNVGSFWCHGNNQFACQSEQRCIPADWRCDFTEQCIDGLDEVGCVRDSCDFKHDLCNWSNTNHALSDQLKRDNSVRETWRRFTGKNRIHETRSTLPPATKSNTLSIEQTLGKGLHQLSANHKTHNFLFAPVVFTQRSGSTFVLNSDNVMLAEIKSPKIGQTNSRCRLEFMYAFWSLQFYQPVELSLELYTRALDDPPTSGEQLVWSDAIMRNHTNNSDQIGWFKAVAELGHLRHFELLFRAKVKALTSNLKYPSYWPEVGTNRRSLPTFVAMTNLKFTSCAWPQIIGQRDVYNIDPSFDLIPRDNVKQKYNYEMSHWIEPNQDETLVNTEPPDEPGEFGQNCDPESEFRCSNDVCVDWRLLCDFVDDCMNEVTDDESLVHGEDELAQVCSRIVGMESFEGRPDTLNSLDTNHLSSFWTLESIGWPNEYIKIQDSIQSGGDQSVAIPRQDHTSKQASGHFLSLEIPAHDCIDDLDLEPANPIIRLVEIESEWLRKSNINDCRVKFFYNLISGERRYHVSQVHGPVRHVMDLYLIVEHFVLNSSSQSIGSPQELIRNVDEVKKASIYKHNDGSYAFHESKTKNESAIQFPGLDFWRQVNSRLDNLELSDAFFIRISVALVPESDQNNQESEECHKTTGGTINFDDFSTHLGCGLIGHDDDRFSSRQKRDTLSQMRKNLTSFAVLKDHPGFASEKIQLDQQAAIKILERTSHEIHRLLDGWNKHMEPHKLVLGVCSLFFSMVGLILAIVFYVVPRVERWTNNSIDGTNVDLTDMRDPRNSDQNTSQFDSDASRNETYETQNDEMDWEQVSRSWRRAKSIHSGPLLSRTQVGGSMRRLGEAQQSEMAQSMARSLSASASMFTESMSPTFLSRVHESEDSFCKLDTLSERGPSKRISTSSKQTDGDHIGDGQISRGNMSSCDSCRNNNMVSSSDNSDE